VPRTWIRLSGSGSGSGRRWAYALLLGVSLLAVLATPAAWFGESKLVYELRNAAHAVAFALACIGWLWLREPESVRSRWLVLIAASAFAMAVEVLEASIGRDPVSYRDMLNNVLGAAIGFAAWLVYRGREAGMSARLRTGMLVGIAASILIVAAPVLVSLEAWVDQKRRFPVLFDAAFSGALQLTESLGDLDEVHIAIEDRAVSVTLLSGPAPGLVVWHFQPDWRGFHHLVIDVENPEPSSLGLDLHVRDRASSFEWSDRFNARHSLEAHTRERIRYSLAEIEAAPRHRNADLEQMATVAIWRETGDADRFILHSIFLE